MSGSDAPTNCAVSLLINMFVDHNWVDAIGTGKDILKYSERSDYKLIEFTQSALDQT